MSRITVRTIAAVGAAAAASMAIVTPAHAAGVTVSESVETSWHVVGVFAGIPGNVHTGNIVVTDGTALDGSPYTSAWVSFADWQCPAVTTSPDSGECTRMRGTDSNGEDSGAAVTLGPKLGAATVDTTFASGWSTPTGWVAADITIDLDLVGTGRVARKVDRLEAAEGGWYVAATQSRSASVRGTVAGVPVDGGTARLVRTTNR
ncbi:hypothetical protein [Knoellia sp. LjRoot47]|uniref:hypothetical protein n=1 Tax=Knoellia sp. LjRoot47 TaxID=3342330 RepID=UPI003ECC19D4